MLLDLKLLHTAVTRCQVRLIFAEEEISKEGSKGLERTQTFHVETVAHVTSDGGVVSCAPCNFAHFGEFAWPDLLQARRWLTRQRQRRDHLIWQHTDVSPAT